MASENRSGEASNRLAGTANATAASRTGHNDDGGMVLHAISYMHGGKDPREGIGDISIEHVVKLGIATNGKKVGSKSHFNRPRLQPGRRGRFVYGAFNSGRRVVGGEMRCYCAGQFLRKLGVQRNGPSMDAKAERDGKSSRVGLMDRGQRMFHVLRPTIIVSGNGQGHLHGKSIAEEEGSKVAASWLCNVRVEWPQ